MLATPYTGEDIEPEVAANMSQEQEEAHWFMREIRRKPFYLLNRDRPPPISKRELAIEKEIEDKKDKDFELFIDKVISVFDPCGSLAKEAGAEDNERLDIVWGMKHAHYKRLMHKDANRQNTKPPDYLGTFHETDLNLTQKVC